MTSRGKDDVDDEFEGFVRGRGELARQLAERAWRDPQRQAAIEAEVEAQLARLPTRQPDQNA
jgi:hypothetical protein